MKEKWFRHPQHGYMLRYDDGTGDTVVTSLVSDSLEMENDLETWKAHKHRLKVNAGCGFLAVDWMEPHDHNPDFAEIDKNDVPVWIIRDFLDAATA